MNRIFALASLVMLCIVTTLAQETPQPTGRLPEHQPAPNEQSAPPKRPPMPEEKSSVTHHTGRIGGQQINYTAKAATYSIKADDGSPKAMFFFVSYTKDDVGDVSKRPLSF